MEWLLASHELGLEGLKQQCIEKIAHDYLTVSDSTVLLSPELLLLIMQEMAEQKQGYKGKIMERVRRVMLKRSGRAICYSCLHGQNDHEYRFFCDTIECPGHKLKLGKLASSPWQRGSTTLSGTFHCSKEAINLQAPAEGSGPFKAWTVVDALLPDSVHEIFDRHHEHAQKRFYGWT